MDRLKERPLLFYGALIIVAILWFMLIFSPLKARERALELRLEQLQVESGRLQREIRRLGRASRELENKKQRLASLRAKQLPGATPQEVSTRLQDLLLKRASAAGLNVLTYRSGGIRSYGPFKAANVRLTANGSTAALVQFLRSIESDNHLLRIASLNAAKVVGKNPVLRITVEVEALIVH